MGKGEIIIGFENDIPPMAYKDENGDLTGFEIEFAQAVFENLGIDIIFKEIDWSEKENELNSKNIDCIWSSMTVTEERRKIYEFSLVYMHNRQAIIIIRKADASKYPDIESLSRVKIATGSSTTGEDVIKEELYLSQADYIPLNSQKDAINALKNGEVDAIVIDYTYAKAYASNENLGLMIFEDIHLEEEEFAVGFRYGSDMAKKVSDVFLNMILDGSLTDLANKYNLYDCYSPIIINDSGYITSKEKMIIGIYGSLPPMSSYDNNGELTGFDIEFAKTLCQRLGITPEFKVILWDKKEIELKSRNIDCIWNGLTVTDARRNNIKFSRVYMSNKQVVIIKKVNASKYTDLKSLSKAKFTALFKSAGEGAIESCPDLSLSEYVGFGTIDDSVLALRNGEADAMVIDYTVAKENVNMHPELMIIDGIQFDEEVNAIGFRVESDMTLIINELMNEMVADGSLDSIARKYGLEDLFWAAVSTNENSDLNNILNFHLLI